MKPKLARELRLDRLSSKAYPSVIILTLTTLHQLCYVGVIYALI